MNVGVLRSLRRLLAAAILLLASAVPAFAQAGGFVYALLSINGGTNQIYGFSVNPTTGVLTALSGFPYLLGGPAPGTRSRKSSSRTRPTPDFMR